MLHSFDELSANCKGLKVITWTCFFLRPSVLSQVACVVAAKTCAYLMGENLSRILRRCQRKIVPTLTLLTLSWHWKDWRCIHASFFGP